MFAHMNHGIKRTGAAIASLTAVATLGIGLVAPSAVAADASGDLNATDVTFQWGVNNETGGGAYFGGCNFLSAGAAGDNGSAGIWAESKGLYKTEDGNVSILKPTADGTLVAPTWATKCTNQYGTTINGKTAGLTMTVAEPAEGAPAEQPTYSGNVVRITKGSGTVNPDTDTAHLEWKGSFSVVYYGGMTYWSMSDPVLDIKDGKGTITATASGYGADMDDATVWKKLESKQIHLADLQNTKVDVTDKGITLTPDYLGVAIDESISGRNAQAAKTDENAAWWGSFPTTWLEYAELTGQSSYWYTSDGNANTIQPRKVADPIDITYTATKPVVADPKVTVDPSTDIDPAKENTFTVKGTGFVGDAAVNGAYVFVIDSAVWKPGQEFKMEYLKQLAGDAVWVKPADIKDGAFTTTVKVPANKLEQGKRYTVVTMAAHQLALTNRTLDTATPITLKATAPAEVPVTGVTVKADKTALTVGDAAKATATVAPANATDKAVSWASSNEKVATVDKDGNVKAVAAGTADIVATAGGKSGKVTVTVKAKETTTPDKPSTDKPAETVKFTDVVKDTPHADDIQWLASEGISKGYEEKDGTYTFGGMNTVVRQDMAAFLYRLAGSPEFDVTKAKNPFADVNEKTPHYKEILWLANQGITEGYTNKETGEVTFGGMNTIVRQDMAAFLKRFADKQQANPTLGQEIAFNDLDTAAHVDEIKWLSSTGVTGGFDNADGTKSFGGMRDVVRQDMAAFLHRMSTNVLTK